MRGPSTGAVAVAEARNISGGVNPSVKLPAAPQPFGSRGPLSRLLGGHLSLIARSRELAYNRLFTTVNTHIIGEPQLSGTCAVAPVLGRIVIRGLSLLEEEKIIIFDSRTHGPIQQDPIRYLKNSAHSHTRKRLSILLTNPHWQRSPVGSYIYDWHDD